MAAGAPAAGSAPEQTAPGAEAVAARPLAGITVVEQDSFVAGPSSCLALSQLGAEVIKIDPLKGGPDIDRWPLTADGRSVYWGTLNRGKRSVALDLRSPEGQELAQALITASGEDPAKTGIFVSNNVGRPFLGDEALRARRADLIHVKVQGTPDGGPGVDYTVNAETGIPGLTGPAGSQGPVNHVLPAWDLLCGQAAATAVVTGLLRRSASGAGTYSEIALADIAFSAVANLGWYTEALSSQRAKHGNHIFGSFGSDFATADGRSVMITAITRRQWTGLVEALGMTAVIEALQTALSTDLADETERYRLRETLVSLFRPWFAARTLAEVTEALSGTPVLWAPYRTTAEVAASAAGAAGADSAAREAEAAGAGAGRASGGGLGGRVLTSLESPELGTMLVGDNPIRVDGEYLGAKRPTVFGQDTHEVLNDRLGLSQTELGRLCDAGIIRS
ncbi:CoA transferase [Brevibacterium album]|uniref:CoA transferase n=1 Tax=Brevibacterium album TaxID=417948 RepID=UPI0003FBF10E|nr:CoA transferase [Brevibacterium album]